MPKSNTMNPNFLAWKTGKLFFQKYSLTKSLSILEKQFDVKFKLSDGIKDNYRFKAKFDNQPLEEILLVIEAVVKCLLLSSIC